MRYQVLGPLRVDRDGAALHVSQPKMRCVLTLLVLHANRVVSKDALVAELWGDQPPRKAMPTLYVYISQLRKLLGEPDRPHGPIETAPPGYLLRVEPEDVDWMRLQQLVRRGRAQLEDGRLTQSARTFEEALGLWYGPTPGPEAVGPAAAGSLTWLDECRLECLESYVEANLQLGRHRTVVSQLVGLVAENPLHEAFYGQLMRALQASERRADALRVYQQARVVLRRELGLEPGLQLRELQSTLLNTAGPARARLVG